MLFKCYLFQRFRNFTLQLYFFTFSNKVIPDNDDDKDDDDDATSKDVEVVEIHTGEALTMFDRLVNMR